MKDIETYNVKDIYCKTSDIQKDEVLLQRLSDYLNRKIAYYSDPRNYEHKEEYEEKNYRNEEIKHG